VSPASVPAGRSASHSASHIVLASGSPRRAELLRQIGLPFVVRPPDVDESLRPGESPERYVERLAIGKARAVVAEDGPVLGADTAVVVDEEILAVTDGRAVRSCVVAADVTFRAITRDEAAAYWETGEPRDKAGGYGIQGIGGIFAQSINGSYSAVVGLPLAETEALLHAIGVNTWELRASV
jgi:septum formation protein